MKCFSIYCHNIRSIARLPLLVLLVCHGWASIAEETRHGGVVPAPVVPLNEAHPRPDFQRDLWQNLNGQWDFDFDPDDVGVKERWYLRHAWSKKIVVPYVHQSPMSGIGDTKHYRQVWYHRRFAVPDSFAGKHVRLHVGAADFRATVWINGKEAGAFEGGQTPFFFDITGLLKANADAENDVVIRVYDNELDPAQPRGKQHPSGKRNRWHYTHVTGIWQTVWLDAVNASHLDRFQAVTTIATPKAQVTVIARTAPDNSIARAILTEPASGKSIAQAEGTFASGQAALTLLVPEAGLWSHEEPNLYDLRLELIVDGRAVDTVDSYLGFRTVETRDGQFLLNGKPVWFNGALDQGYWPQSLLTHPSDEAAIDDIKWVKRLGLNHIRKHQVVADPRFLYHCDRLGLLVWGEMANAGEGALTERTTSIAQREWQRVIQRDFNHPCLVTWVYSNENWMHGGALQDRTDHYRRAYHQMKEWDPTRPVIDTSGYHHVESDILDVHYYTPQRRLADTYRWACGELDQPSENMVFLTDMPYRKQPIVVSEWVAEGFDDYDSQQQRPWLRAYLQRLTTFATHPLCAGHCYVQLYDVENERNGYLYYDRRSKMSRSTEATLRAAHLQAARRDMDFDWKGFIDAGLSSIHQQTLSLETDSCRLQVVPSNQTYQIQIHEGDHLALASPAEGLWSIATDWKDDWPTGWRHGSPQTAERLGPWLVLTGKVPTDQGDQKRCLDQKRDQKRCLAQSCSAR